MPRLTCWHFTLSSNNNIEDGVYVSIADKVLFKYGKVLDVRKPSGSTDDSDTIGVSADKGASKQLYVT